MRRITLLGSWSSLLLACRPGTTPEPPPTATPAPRAPQETLAPTATDAPPSAAAPATETANPARICAAIEADLDAGTLHGCKIVGGVSLEAGRADIVQVQFEEPAMGEVTQAFVALQADAKAPSFELAGESYFVPGEETTYVLGDLRVVDGKVHLEVTETTTIFPNTGDPDAEPEEEAEVVRRHLVCDVLDGVCDELR